MTRTREENAVAAAYDEGHRAGQLETYDQLEVRVTAQLSAILTMALLHDGITLEDVAENLAVLLDADPQHIKSYIDGFEILSIAHEDGRTLIQNKGLT